MSKLLSKSDFDGKVGDTFLAEVGSQSVPLTLTDVAASIARNAPKEARAPFKLEFNGPAEIFLRQKIYPLTHLDLGRVDIFLVPVAQKPDRSYAYQAVFN